MTEIHQGSEVFVQFCYVAKYFVDDMDNVVKEKYDASAFFNAIMFMCYTGCLATEKVFSHLGT